MRFGIGNFGLSVFVFTGKQNMIFALLTDRLNSEVGINIVLLNLVFRLFYKTASKK